MRTFNTYQQPPAETPLARKWFIRALVASIIIHVGIFLAFRSTKLKDFAPYTTARLVPRNFSLTRVSVNESQLSQSAEPEKKQTEEPKGNSQQPVPSIAVPDEKPAAETNPPDVVFTPTGADPIKAIATDNPKVSDSDLRNLANMQKAVSKELDNDLNKVSEQLINDKTPTSSKSTLKFSETTKPGVPGSATGNDSAIPGMKSLDDALSSTGGGLQSGDKIGIRGGALFEFDKADLLPAATDGLRNLAAYVKNHPKATLIIEGYADSIGSQTDPQYNTDLSQRRADSVKNFLQSAGVDQSRIQAVGKGSTNFIDPPTYDPAKQALEPDNRRVEIIFTFPR